MNEYILLATILGPAVGALLVLAFRGKTVKAVGPAVCAMTLGNLVLAAMLFTKKITLFIPFTAFGLDISFRLYQFSAFILLAAAAFSFLISLYAAASLREFNRVRDFYFYLLLTLGLVNGAVLADNLLLMLFFWEGLLGTLYGMISIGRKRASQTAIKAFIIVGVSDLCMMFGIALTSHLAGTLAISKIHLTLDNNLTAMAFIFMMIGAISKAGSMPFHSWIPDASEKAPLPFMAFLPAALEKLLGIYFLARICLDLFKLLPGTWLSYLLMTIGVITILFAVMMALIQKDYKRLLSYHAISQVGYMILGIGTALPVGILGGLFHMINHAMYKSCLFLTGGAVEKQAGTTDLEKISGLFRRMPVTFLCFFIAAASISGVPPFNGFFSKELVYEAALHVNPWFYIAAILGSFFTAASFLKLGHAAFGGKLPESLANTREAPLTMLVPMFIIASFCVLFGGYNYLPLHYLIEPVLGNAGLQVPMVESMPALNMLTIVTLLVLGGALFNHLMGARATGSGLRAAEHIHDTPLLLWVYDKAEQKNFDPYLLGRRLWKKAGEFLSFVDKKIDWIFEIASPVSALALTERLRRLQSGNYAFYIFWSLVAMVLIIVFAIK